MSIAVGDYLDVQMRLSELGLPSATGLTLLPTNLSSAPTAGDLLRAFGGRHGQEPLQVSRSRLCGVTGSSTWNSLRSEQRGRLVGPIIFVAGSLWSQNPLAVSVR